MKSRTTSSLIVCEKTSSRLYLIFSLGFIAFLLCHIDMLELRRWKSIRIFLHRSIVYFVQIIFLSVSCQLKSNLRTKGQSWDIDRCIFNPSVRATKGVFEMQSIAFVLAFVRGSFFSPSQYFLLRSNLLFICNFQKFWHNYHLPCLHNQTIPGKSSSPLVPA